MDVTRLYKWMKQAHTNECDKLIQMDATNLYKWM